MFEVNVKNSSPKDKGDGTRRDHGPATARAKTIALNQSMKKKPDEKICVVDP